MIIGVMGMSGSGKSTFCSFLKELGAEVIDADKIAREVLDKGTDGLKEVEERFGREVIFSDGSLDRKKLGSIIFNNPEKLEILNSITTKRIDNEIIKRAKESKSDFIVIDCPMLHNIDAKDMCDKIVLVKAPVEVMTERIIKRDSLTYEGAKARISAQESDFHKFADIVIENNGTLEDLRNQAKKLKG